MEKNKRKHKCLDNQSYKRFKATPQPSYYKSLPPFDFSKFKGVPFEKLLEEFKIRNKHFLESLQIENSVLKVSVSPKYSFGNYTKKYPWGDPRIPFIPKELIENKKCLEIGHGNGEFAIQLVKAYNPEIIVGCDIDPVLTKQAISTLQNGRAKLIGKERDSWSKIKELPKSFQSDLESRIRRDNILFVQENYIANIEAKFTFDTIICLETIPWIHLNYGDTGVIALFYKVYMNLKESGVFIFEEETLKEYKKKAKKSPELKVNFNNIAFTPDRYTEFLTEILKLTLMEQKIAYDQNVLDKPILIFKKNVL